MAPPAMRRPMTYPATVAVVEVGPRDGLQEDRIYRLNGLGVQTCASSDFSTCTTCSNGIMLMAS